MEIQSTSKFVLSYDGEELLVEIKKGTGIGKPNIAEGDEVEVTGILASYKDGFKLLPRFAEDIEIPDRELAASGEKLKEPISLSKGQIAKILSGLAGASGIGMIAMGTKYKDRIFPWRKRKQEVVEEEIDFDE